jgi:hypothetical protein
MVIIGRQAAQRSLSISADKTRGRRSAPEFTGTRNALLGVAAALGQQEWDIQPIDAPLYQLTVKEPDIKDGSADDQGTVTWEMVSNAVQKDILQHPRSQALAASYLEDIRKFFEQDMTSAPVWMGGVGSPPADAVTLFNMMLKGQKHFQTDQYVLRKTQIVPYGTNIELGYAMTSLLFTSAQMVGADWNFAIPTDLVFVIGGVLATAVPWNWTTPSGYSWAWLKRAPQVDQVAGNKWRIVDEYWFDCWSQYLYQAAPATPSLLI